MTNGQELFMPKICGRESKTSTTMRELWRLWLGVPRETGRGPWDVLVRPGWEWSRLPGVPWILVWARPGEGLRVEANGGRTRTARLRHGAPLWWWKTSSELCCMYCFNATSPTDYDFHFSNHHLMADAFILITIVVLVNSLGCRAVVRPLGKSQLFTIQPTRSSSCLTLSRRPVTSHRMFSNRAISITAPRLWNDIPPELRTVALPPTS